MSFNKFSSNALRGGILLLLIVTVQLSHSQSVFAQSYGGNGGISPAGGQGGTGGSLGEDGGTGTSDTGGTYGGGGGGGGPDGSGGQAGNARSGSAGTPGRDGSVAAPGGTGGSLPRNLGAGGGGGGAGIRVTDPAQLPITVTSSFSGGGGSGGRPGFGGGGGGGAGGYGIWGLATPLSVTIENSATVRGGVGGQGSVGSFGGGSGGGGDGGVGVYLPGTGSTLTIVAGAVHGGDGAFGAFGPFNAGLDGKSGNGATGVLGSGLSIVNAGTIQGGNGGTAGTEQGVPGNLPGTGGLGINGKDLTINNNSGMISGGFANAGVGAQNYALQLTGGANYVGGAGQINGGINVINGASFQPALPGSTVGTPLAVNGPMAFAPGSFYNVRITPTASDSTVATGAATLTGATVQVAAGNGTYQVRRYTILTAKGGLGGTRFSGVTSNLAFLMPTLTYVGNDVILNVAGNAGGGAIDYRTAAQTQNQRNVAGGLTNASMATLGGSGGRVLNALNQLTVPQAQAAFDSLSGEGITAAQNVAQRSTQLFTSSIFDQTTFYGSASTGNSITLSAPQPGFSALAPDQTLAASAKSQPIRELADLPAAHIAPTFVAPQRTWRAWATGFGGVEDIHGNGAIGSADQQNTIYGGALGVDYQLMPNYLLGVAVGGSDGDFNVSGRATSGSTTGGHIAFYDLATFGAFYGASSTSFSYFNNRTTRFVGGFGGLGNETERGTFDSHEFRSRLEFGRHFDGFGGVVTPFVALEIAELRSNGFGETAVTGPGLFRLNVQGQSAASVPAFVGARLQERLVLGNGMVLTPTLQAAWVHEFAPYRSQIGSIADLPGSTFLVDGAQPARNAAQIKAGAELAIGARTAIFANFDGELSGVNQLYAGKGGVRIAW